MRSRGKKRFLYYQHRRIDMDMISRSFSSSGVPVRCLFLPPWFLLLLMYFSKIDFVPFFFINHAYLFIEFVRVSTYIHGTWFVWDYIFAVWRTVHFTEKKLLQCNSTKLSCKKGLFSISTTATTERKRENEKKKMNQRTLTKLQITLIRFLFPRSVVYLNYPRTEQLAITEVK